MTWTRVSCCLVCSCILVYMLLDSCVSFMVAVPVSHFSVSPKKSIRLLIDHGFWVVSVFRILTQFWATVLLTMWLVCKICRCCPCWKIHIEWHWVQSVMVAVGLGVSLVNGELRSPDGWTYIVVYLSHLVICGLSLSMNAVLGMPLELDEITHSQCCVSCLSSAKVPMKCRLKRVFFMSNGFFIISL